MKLQQVYDTIKNLKMFAKELYYIDTIQSILNNYDFDSAFDIISELTDVYYYELNEIGQNISNRPVVQREVAEQYYTQADDEDVLQDLRYLQLCLVAIAGVKCGILKSYDEVADELDI